MPSTGEKCQQSGIYAPEHVHAKEIALSVGETFPPCHGCHQAIKWTLKTATKKT